MKTIDNLIDIFTTNDRTEPESVSSLTLTYPSVAYFIKLARRFPLIIDSTMSQ